VVGRMPGRRVDLRARLASKAPRKLLAMDGGGIRGLLSPQILEEIEKPTGLAEWS
jgi:patatin-like phospholipase/acyl hydrolase